MQKQENTSTFTYVLNQMATAKPSPHHETISKKMQ